MSYRKVFSIVGLTLVVTFVAVAHDTWLAPRRFSIKRHSQVKFDLTSGMSFPVLETSIKPDRVDAAVCRLNNKFVKLLKPIRFRLTLLEGGDRGRARSDRRASAWRTG